MMKFFNYANMSLIDFKLINFNSTCYMNMKLQLKNYFSIHLRKIEMKRESWYKDIELMNIFKVQKESIFRNVKKKFWQKTSPVNKKFTFKYYCNGSNLTQW